jgi:hypothetical protein
MVKRTGWGVRWTLCPFQCLSFFPRAGRSIEKAKVAIELKRNYNNYSKRMHISIYLFKEIYNREETTNESKVFQNV